MGNKIRTVGGPISSEQAGLADAHGHLWIAKVPGQAACGAPVLDDYPAIEAELQVFFQAGGRTVVDCQPGFCGRDVNRLVQLSRATDVQIIASTGFHLQRYYPTDHWLWSSDEQAAHALFLAEIAQGMQEASQADSVPCAGLIKIAITEEPDVQTLKLMNAAASVSRETGASVLVHTERGEWAEKLPSFFSDRGVQTTRLIVCHMDKRPDFKLHEDLAKSGVLLVYDTFLRPKYQPEQNVWPLIEKMVSAGLDHRLALALDAADASLWRFRGGPGISYLPDYVVPRLYQIGLGPYQVQRLSGENLAQRLCF